MKVIQRVSLTVCLALLACSAHREPCARLIRRAEPFRGELREGQIVRAIVETGSAPFAHTIMALYASEPGPRSAQFLYFPDSGVFDLEEPTLLVFRVTDSMMVHTPPDAGGSYEYVTQYFAELLAIEMSQRSAVSRAWACLEELQPDGRWDDAEDPFAHGPGERGGWLFRFASPEPAGLPVVEFEIDRDGVCHRTG